jgi:site-specific DNA-methyltransferase (adenine-specific)
MNTNNSDKDADSNTKSPYNKTITLTEHEQAYYSEGFVYLRHSMPLADLQNKIINQDIHDTLPFLPNGFVDLLIMDPPYNMTRQFNRYKFSRVKKNEYKDYIDSLIKPMLPLLKPNASIYFCSEWQSSLAVYEVLSDYFYVRNRIVWEREKGRGSYYNWKNTSEDIWFATLGHKYTFNVDHVKLKKRIIAPYRHNDGRPKDWQESEEGNYRLTYPSNLWTDITVPYWSMAENTDHPTQKPEKLLAKLVLASSREGDVLFDPFVGSGTSAVVAHKLGRRYVVVEMDRYYCSLTAKRIAMAQNDDSIQGYGDGVFWERNSFPYYLRRKQSKGDDS